MDNKTVQEIQDTVRGVLSGYLTNEPVGDATRAAVELCLTRMVEAGIIYNFKVDSVDEEPESLELSCVRDVMEENNRNLQVIAHVQSPTSLKYIKLECIVEK